MEQERFNVHIDRDRYTEKPTARQTAKISKNIVRNIENLTLEQIGNKLAQGYSILPSIMNNQTRNMQNFKECSIILMDFDNEGEQQFTLDDTLTNEFILNHAGFRYETFNSTEAKNKFRLVFVLDEKIETIQEFKIIYDFLLSKLPLADTACRDVSRLFYGGKNLHIFNLNNRLSKMDILSSHVVETVTPVQELGDYQPIDIPENYTANNDVVDALKTANFDVLKAHIDEHELELGVSVNSVTEGLQALYRVDTFKLLGLEYIAPFNCILSEDNNPSASIFKNAEDVFIYKRFSQNPNKQYVFNNLQLITKITKLNTNEVINKLFSLLKIKVNYPKEIKMQDLEISKFLMKLETMDLKTNYPYTYKILGRRLDILGKLLIMFMEEKFEYIDENGNLHIEFINRLGSKKITKLFLGDTSDYKVKKLQKTLSVLAYLDIIEKLDDENIPSDILEDLNSHKIDNKYKRRKNLLKLNVENLSFEKIERKAKELTDINYTVGSFKADFLVINGDLDDVDKVFNQDKKRRIARKTDNFLSDMIEYIDLNLSDNLYIFEKDLKDYLSNKYNKTYVLNNYNVCIHSALESLSCTRLRANTHYKNLFNISNLTIKQTPYIIIKSSSV